MKTTALRAAMGGLLLGCASVSFANPLICVMAATPAEQITALETKRQGILDASQAIVDALEEGVDLTDEQADEISANAEQVASIDKRINALKTMLPKGQGRQSAAEPQNAANGGKTKLAATVRDTQRHNFNNMGEFAIAVRAQKLGDFENEGVKKLMNAATTYGNEGTGADGGFLVPPEFSQAIWQKVEAEDALMSRCAELTPEGNSMHIPKDETTPWGSTGLQVYWDGEGAAATPSKGVFETSQLRLFKLTALAPVSEEMLEDARGFESWIKAKVPGIMSHKINTAILDGSGAGMPLGALRSPSLISVAKETSQPADSIWKANVDKMWARMYAPWRRNAIWIINQDAEPALEAMGYSPSGVVPTAASMPVYLPPGGVSEAPYARLKGRPVIPLQAAKTVGDQGDIMLIDLQQYWLLRKASGIKTDTSIHLYFDQSVTAFKWVFRLNGQPAWSSVITPQNGSNTLSWAVTLDAR